MGVPIRRAPCTGCKRRSVAFARGTGWSFAVNVAPGIDLQALFLRHRADYREAFHEPGDANVSANGQTPHQRVLLSSVTSCSMALSGLCKHGVPTLLSTLRTPRQQPLRRRKWRFRLSSWESLLLIPPVRCLAAHTHECVQFARGGRSSESTRLRSGSIWLLKAFARRPPMECPCGTSPTTARISVG